MTSLQDDVDAIQAICSDARRITLFIEGILSEIDAAAQMLRGIDDPHASGAEANLSAARADLRDAVGGWFDDYLRRSEMLCRRISD